MIHTERLNLRPFTKGDAPFLLRLVNEPSWIEFIGDRNVHTLEDAESYLERGPMNDYLEHGFGFWLVEDRLTREPVGMCGCTRREYLDHPDLGFAFLPEHTGRGLAFEAASAYVLFARDTLHLSVLFAFAQDENERSIRLLKKLGFQYDRILMLEGEALSLYRINVADG